MIFCPKPESARNQMVVSRVLIHLFSSTLTVVLGEWCPRFPGLCLYYPGHRQVPAGLRAFIDVLKEEARRARETSSAP